MIRRRLAWALMAILVGGCGIQPPATATDDSPVGVSASPPDARASAASSVASTPGARSSADWAQIYPEAFDVVGEISDVAVGPAGIVLVGSVEVRLDVHAWAAWSSTDGLTWERTLLSPPGQGDGGYGRVVWTPDGFLAIGAIGDALIGRRSADGRDWRETRLDGLDHTWPPELMASDLGLIARATVCQNAAWRSTDGSSWTRLDLPEATQREDDTACEEIHQLRPTRFGLIAFGTGVVWRSVDGERWEGVAGPWGAVPIQHVSDTAGGVVAIGEGMAWTSNDGRTWADAGVISSGSPGDLLLEEVTLVGAQLLAARQGDSSGQIWSSGDGRQWTLETSQDGDVYVRGFAEVDARFLAIGTAFGTNAFGRVVGRPAVWASPPPPGEITSPSIAPSADARPVAGITWERIGEIRGSIEHLAGDGAGLLAVGRDEEDLPALWSSSDGRSWTSASGESPDFMGGDHAVISTGGGAFVAIVNGIEEGRAWSSPDGRAWQRLGSIDAATHCPDGFPSAGVLDAVANESTLVAVGMDCGVDRRRFGAWISRDGGETWKRAGVDPNGLQGHSSAVTFNLGTYTAVGGVDGKPAAWTSRDGETWTSRLLLAEGSAPLTSVAVGPSGLVALGAGTVWTLPEGIAWVRPEQPGFEAGDLEHIVSGGRIYYAWGGSGVWASLSGRSWTQLAPVDGGGRASSHRISALLAFDGRIIIATVDPEVAKTTFWSASTR